MANLVTRQPKSKEGALRQIDALIRSYRREFAGGGAFGFDWPTLRLNSPERYERIRDLQRAYANLPSRHA
jgi:hypothetical protein